MTTNERILELEQQLETAYQAMRPLALWAVQILLDRDAEDTYPDDWTVFRANDVRVTAGHLRALIAVAMSLVTAIEP